MENVGVNLGKDCYADILHKIIENPMTMPGRMEIIKLLIRFHADVNGVGKKGRTPLMIGMTVCACSGLWGRGRSGLR